MSTVKLSRRDFLRFGVGAGAGLWLGFHLPAAAAPAAAPAGFRPNAFLRVARNGRVTVWVTRSEMGQGVQTALPAILAEELEADWSRIGIRQAPYDPKFGEQNTGGSTSVRTMWGPLRHAGASAREMLITAAARRWRVDRATCHAAQGAVVHEPSRRRLGYGALAAAAARLPVPTAPPLKPLRDLHLVGRSLARLDVPDKVAGTAVFGIDVRVPGMLYASVERCPVFGGTLASFDAARAKAVPGVRDVVAIARGVAVVADSSWAAQQGRAALTVRWKEGPTAAESTLGLSRQLGRLAARPGKVVRRDGDVAAALKGATRRVEGRYELPFLAHATMEPQVATADVRRDRCVVWAPTQSPASAHATATRVSGLPGRAVTVNVTLLGGGFGRRSFPDPVEEAVAVSKAVGRPVQVLYTRADDLRHDFYRPASSHRLTAALDKDGWPTAWHHRYAATPLMTSIRPDTTTPEAMDLGGAADLPYAIPNVQVEFAAGRSGVPRGWLRSVAHTYTAFVVESFLDEIAAAGGKDPYALRRHLLREPRRIPYPGRNFYCETARLKRVLEVAATKAGWGRPLPPGRGRGIAHHFSFHSYCAQVVEASRDRTGWLRVHRVVCAVDCGRVVNPDIVAAQIESAVALALSFALRHEITIEKGRVIQGNFDDYPLLPFDEMPPVEVHLVASDAPPTGVGEPGVPPTAPALANALFAATGRRARLLPMRPEHFR